MAYRHVTPPSAIEIDDYDALQCPGGSASSRTSYDPNDWSPATAWTAATTPPKSPQKFPWTEATYGPTLLPQARPQAYPPLLSTPRHAHLHHSRTVSLPGNAASTPFGGVLPARDDAAPRRSVSPYSEGPLHHNPYKYAYTLDPPSVRPSSSRSNGNPVHTRSSSTQSLDASTITRYGYPTHRESPSRSPLSVESRAPRSVAAMNHLAPISLSRGNIQPQPAQRRTVSPAAKPSSRPSRGVESADDPNEPTSTVLYYLTSPNPAPYLTQRVTEHPRSLNTHFWFDIRNLRPWSDFSIDTIAAIPGLVQLLKVNIDARHFPTPGPVNLSPETPAQLAELWARYHAVKVNAALLLAQGEKMHMTMRALSATPGTRQQPEFVANYKSDGEKTIFGDGRGRVVGIVKCFEQWNSGMRMGGPNEQVRYLRHLAHLHRFMREHGTRYGFIATEMELVCVRAGGLPTADNVPLFGFLELAPPVHIATSARSPAAYGAASPYDELHMTADLALWYLHMLAKEQPFLGQFHWRLDVGAPAALTRRRHEPRDAWMPKPNVSEKREAKRIRGWVWPDEPLSKREVGRGTRRRER